MSYPFPGMDPYLEHPVLWEGVHTRLILAMANQLQPQLDPRYVASVEERVFVEGPQRRIPDIWVQKVEETPAAPVAQPQGDTAVILEIDELEIHQKRIEILDAYNELKLVAVIELVSPTNKRAGPGKDSYLQKQEEILAHDCHLVEIDLHRKGTHVLSIPDWKAKELGDYDYLACVSRWPQRHRYRLYPAKLRKRLPRIFVPLADPDPDVPLDLQTALEQVYVDGRYAKRIRYHEPCEPSLPAEDQAWANELLTAFRATRNGPAPQG